ncbi:hypothetical protein [Flavobacterium sp. 3HN19-14]|uniref:hypothetical protein n=1 Tax=Flavobacterium sp. 3HN19-14 TaxID=3448133 RepID=UPI003EE314A9
MKKSILLYLFILALLFNVFTYMYYSKKADFDQAEADKGYKHLRDSLTLVTSKLNDANYFSLETNDNAQEYFEKDNLDYLKLMPQIKDALLSYNDDPKGNKYVGFDKLGEQKFIINKIKILNHRWIIADFNDGKIWGEVLIKYFVNTDGTFDFETVQTLLYQ